MAIDMYSYTEDREKRHQDFPWVVYKNGLPVRYVKTEEAAQCFIRQQIEGRH